MKQIVLLKFFFVIVFYFFGYTSTAQLTEKYPGYEGPIYKGMKYCLFKPPYYDEKVSYPLVMVLHGWNDTIPHDFVYYSNSFQQADPCFVLFPISTGSPYVTGEGWFDVANIGEINTGLGKAFDILEMTIDKYNIDSNRIYIRGGSMGGFGALTLLSKYPGKFAAGYIVCGGGKMEFARTLLNTPLWFFHGQVDDVVPIHLSRNIYDEVKKLGGEQIRYTEYPCVAHDSWINAANEKTLETWLFKQKKGATSQNPPKVEGLKVEANGMANVLTWIPGSDISDSNNEIWYYKIIRNGVVVAEVDGDIHTYADNVMIYFDKYNYKIVAVNYFFRESEASR